MKARGPQVSVVIPAYNEEKTIRQTLAALANQTTNVPFEVIVVDNNCSDRTINIAGEFTGQIKRLKIIRESQQGIAAARQRGFATARGQIIASTDADAVVPPDWLERIWNSFQQDGRLTGLTGTYEFAAKSPVFNGLARTIMIGADWTHRLLTGSFGFRGVNFAVTKDAWRAAGGFDKQISALEDVDLALRVGRKKRIKYVADLVVVTGYRRFAGNFFRQLAERAQAYFYRVIYRKTDKETNWEVIR